MKPNYVVRTYLESILNDDETINCTKLVESNANMLKKAVGITDKSIELIEKSLRTRFYYWRKFTRTKPSVYTGIEQQSYDTTDDTIFLHPADLEYMNELCNERVIRLPINAIRWDEDEQSFVTDRDRMCTLHGIERYVRGDFGCEIMNIDDPKIFNEYANEAKQNPNKVRSWAYVNVSPKGENLRAY